MKSGLGKEVRMATRRLWAVLSTVLSAAAVFSMGGCSSNHSFASNPPYPVDPDPCATYCMVWVPPTYRDVPRVCPGQGGTCSETVCRKRIELEEVCTPGHYEKKCSPDVCRKYAIVEAEPAHTEWKKVKCCTPCGPAAGCCFRPVEVPAQYKVCERQDSEKGIEYCTFTPPEYGVKPVCVYDKLKVTHYVPAEAKIIHEKQLFQPGHWEWQQRYCGCDAPKKDCPRAPVCAPPPPADGGCGCGGAGGAQVRKGNFNYAPPAN